MSASLDVVAVGVTSAFGLDAARHSSFWSGHAAPIREEWREGFAERLSGSMRFRSAGEVDVRPLLKQPKLAKFLTREMCLALHAANQVRPALHAMDGERIGVVIATAPALSSLQDISGVRDKCAVDGVLEPARLAANLTALIPATWPFRCLKATLACHMATEFAWYGPSLTLSPHPLSGLDFISVAELLLESGAADVIVAGGSDSRSDVSGATEMLNRRCARLGVEKIDGALVSEGVSEGAALMALRREGEGAAIARLSLYRELHFTPSTPKEDIASAVRTALRDTRAHTLWIDLPPEFSPSGLTIADLETDSFEHVVDVCVEAGVLGVAAASMALAAACHDAARLGQSSTVLCAAEQHVAIVHVGAVI